MLRVERTNRFKKDIELQRKRGKNLEELSTIIAALSTGKKLDKKYKDHPLKGNYKVTMLDTGNVT